jgi:thiamine-monophosphate kinase
MASEFQLIERYFAGRGALREDVVLGVGDDAALLRVPQGMDLAVAVDTMVEGVHFSPEADPESLGHKILAVNLSDLAAMGAEPAWATLALTLPKVDEAWLERFGRGLHTLAQRCRVALVGGDTTRGPLALTVQVHGFVPTGQAIRRGGARPGDLVYVTGCLGDAGLALLVLQEEVRLPGRDRTSVLERLDRPQPRLAQGLALRGLASAAIDVSDGLAADLGHILEASGVGATVQVQRLPVSAALKSVFDAAGGWALPLSAGDDYELCFSVPERRQAELEKAFRDLDVGCTWIGWVERDRGLRCVLDDGSMVVPAAPGYDHFSGA